MSEILKQRAEKSQRGKASSFSAKDEQMVLGVKVEIRRDETG